MEPGAMLDEIKLLHMANVNLKEAAKIVSRSGVPHYINASNPRDNDIEWDTPDWIETDLSLWTFTNWDQESGQPNDCIVEETCVFIGPHGKVTLKTSYQ